MLHVMAVLAYHQVPLGHQDRLVVGCGICILSYQDLQILGTALVMFLPPSAYVSISLVHPEHLNGPS